MVEVASRPIMMHVMDIYSHLVHHDCIVACGYKCLLIKSFFQDLHLMNNDFTVALTSGGMTLRPTGKIDWNVSVVDTGQTTMTGGRLLRLRDWLDIDTFMVTYSAGVGNIDTVAMQYLHRAPDIVTPHTGVQP